MRKDVTAPLGDHTIEETVDFLHASGELHANLCMNGPFVRSVQSILCSGFNCQSTCSLGYPMDESFPVRPCYMASKKFPVHLEAAESRRQEGTATKKEFCTVIQYFQRSQGKTPTKSTQNMRFMPWRS